MFYYMSIDKNILLGKEEASGSNPDIGSSIIHFYYQNTFNL